MRIRTMTKEDIPAGMRLKESAGWNQTAADWSRFLEASPEGCFVAEIDGRVCGTAATISFEKRFAWVGMVLVDPESSDGCSSANKRLGYGCPVRTMRCSLRRSSKMSYGSTGKSSGRTAVAYFVRCTMRRRTLRWQLRTTLGSKAMLLGAAGLSRIIWDRGWLRKKSRRGSSWKSF